MGKGNLTIITDERQSPTQSTPSHIEPEANKMPFSDFLKSDQSVEKAQLRLGF